MPDAIFNNDFNANNPTDDVLTVMEILKTARPAERKAYMESLNPNDRVAQQLQVVEEEYQKAKATQEGVAGDAKTQA